MARFQKVAHVLLEINLTLRNTFASSGNRLIRSPKTHVNNFDHISVYQELKCFILLRLFV